MPSIRIDRTAFKQKADITDEGFLKTDAVVTRTGIFYYKNADGSVRAELRPPEEVFAPDSLKSMRLIPITNMHPKAFVDSANAAELSVGCVGENVRPDGTDVVAPIVIHRGDAVQCVREGRRELSLGYNVDLIDEAGEFQGEPYDSIQKNIRYNHLALVDCARAGRDAAIHLDGSAGFRLDSTDSVEITKEEFQAIRNDSLQPIKRKAQNMTIYKIDGCDYEAAQEIINLIGKKDQKIDSLSGEVATLKGSVDSVSAERDDLRDQVTKEKAKNTDEAIAARVLARVALEQKAAKVLDAEGMAALVGKTDAELKAAVVAKHCDGLDLSGKSPEYIAARFDIAIESVEGKKEDAVADQFAAANAGAEGKKEDAVDSFVAHENMKKAQDEAYLNYKG